MNSVTTLFQRVDSFIFQKMDELKANPQYNRAVEFYSTLDDEYQKVAKWFVLLSSALIPLLVVAVLWWQNANLQNELDNRLELIETMNQIIVQNSEIGGLAGNLAADSALMSESALQTRLSSALSSSGVNLASIQVSNFTSETISPTLTRAEADIKFIELTTEQLMNVFIALMQREKLKISSVDITRNNKTNLLNGTFHGVHFGQVLIQEED